MFYWRVFMFLLNTILFAVGHYFGGFKVLFFMLIANLVGFICGIITERIKYEKIY